MGLSPALRAQSPAVAQPRDTRFGVAPARVRSCRLPTASRRRRTEPRAEARGPAPLRARLLPRIFELVARISLLRSAAFLTPPRRSKLARLQGGAAGGSLRSGLHEKWGLPGLPPILPLSTASKRNAVMAAYGVLRPSGGEKCGLAAYTPTGMSGRLRTSRGRGPFGGPMMPWRSIESRIRAARP